MIYAEAAIFNMHLGDPNRELYSPWANNGMARFFDPHSGMEL
jgi:hypothetical protein